MATSRLKREGYSAGDTSISGSWSGEMFRQPPSQCSKRATKLGRPGLCLLAMATIHMPYRQLIRGSSSC